MLGIMTPPIPMFACFAGSHSRELETIIFVVVGSWIVTLALGCANFVLICLTGDRRFKAAHFTCFAAYGAAASAMSFGLLPDGAIILALAIGFGVPAAVIVHFVTLIYARRRTRLEDAR